MREKRQVLAFLLYFFNILRSVSIGLMEEHFKKLKTLTDKSCCTSLKGDVFTTTFFVSGLRMLSGLHIIWFSFQLHLGFQTAVF